MALCDVCGNDYADAFQVTTRAGERFTFDSIECAAHKIAPRCRHCQCSVLGMAFKPGKVSIAARVVRARAGRQTPWTTPCERGSSADHGARRGREAVVSHRANGGSR